MSGTALVLSGGGARGAYQVGVLQGLLEIGAFGDGDPVFDVLVGSSAGAINAAMLAACADEIRTGVEQLERVWTSIEPTQVFRTDLRSLGGIGARWVRDLSFGGLLRKVTPKSLLDTAPLRELLAEHVPFERIDRNIETGRLRALAMPATDLYTSDGILFLDAKPEVPLWRRGRWSVERTPIRVDHVMASSAIPVFFPSIQIDGRHLGDGSVRNTAPLSPAINLGARRVVAIGVRQPSVRTGKVRRIEPPSIAQVAGALLDAVMLDAIGVDVEHSERVNQSLLAYPDVDAEQGFRWVDVLWLSPQRHFHEIAAEFSDRIPAAIRYLMRGLGSDEETRELASYLLFDAAYCRRLVEIGHADVTARRDEVQRFLEGRRAEPQPASSPK
ncbi:MAG: patatin-like phospholipase family protein [Myxococcota bacterium]|nr:patatin-like phospholipase family protein [Myxococcota bacterium]